MNKILQTFKYIISDFLAALVSWSIFYFYRKFYVDSTFNFSNLHNYIDNKFIIGIIFIPFFWILLHYLSGYYNKIYRKSRFNEFGQTLFITSIGVIIIFFALILDDIIQSYTNYYLFFCVLLLLQFFFTYFPRLIITSITNKKIQKGSIGFNTIIIGSNEKALETFFEIKNQTKSTGYKIIGFVNVNCKTIPELEKQLKVLGNLNNLKAIINQNKIEEVIIAIESSEHEEIGRIVNLLDIHNLNINIIPDVYDILMGSVKVHNIYGTPFIQIANESMPEWQKCVKQMIDIVFSALALIVLFPICIFLAIGVKLTSKGNIFYSHDRIGRFGKPFKIYKFRSMYMNSEQNGPELSSKNDKRVTSFGRFMRKTRLDEIPNFVNVLKGEMSIVGPRPERQAYINQIVERAPQYYHLHKVKPGITSLGQVKFGYAENVDQMLKRLRYDLLYMENMSLFFDFKIMVYTIVTIFKGHGL